MNITLQTALLATEMPLQERLVYGLQVFVVGFFTVFAALAVLLGVLMIFRLFAYDIPNKKKKAAEAAAAPVAAPAPEVSEAPADGNDTQLIAVITAAIEAYNSSNGATALPFRVVSYKRIKTAGGWQGAENNESF